MSSVVPGYEYDIFISYRQNDNRSGWVSEFVKNLEAELSTCIKYPVSLYFDSNPHDGLLETHNVDRSLKEKLKCLIFIPILSQTYCDPKSFAWQHEFLAFIRLAEGDAFGKDVKLLNRNVTSRVLAIAIHELEQGDRSLVEKETGARLRPINFIFKSPGVNRPIGTNEEHPQANIYHTTYKDQINKVANAVKEIIAALSNSSDLQDSELVQVNHSPARTATSPLKKHIWSGVAIVSLVIGLAWLSYHFLRSTEATATEVTPVKSVAVLPFVNLSEDKEQEYFSDGLTEELLNSLSQLDELIVMAKTTSFAFKNKNLPAPKIADSLNVNYIVEGSVRKAGSNIRITARLTNADAGVLMWTDTYDRTLDDIFKIQEDIAENIANNLNIYLDDKSRSKMFEFGTKNVSAYENFLKGRALFFQNHSTLDVSLWDANVYFDKALQFDSTFAAAYWHKHDAFLHYLIGSENNLPPHVKDANDAYVKMTENIDKAIALTTIPSKQNLYRFAKTFFSHDWTNLNYYAELFINNPDAAKVMAEIETGYCTFSFVLLGKGDKLFEICKEAVVHDPLQSTLWTRGTLGALAAKKFDEAYSFAKKGEQVLDTEISWASVPASILVGKQIKSANPQFHPIVLSRNGERVKAIKLADQQYAEDSLNFFLIWAYAELNQNDKANFIAANIDRMVLGHVRLAALCVFSYGMKERIFFDLEATPNFAARLKEAGIQLKNNRLP